jgi:nicotinamide riboside kinase
MGLCIAIVGAESTGKSTLATDLAAALADATGLRCTVVPEALRLWCEREGRTPRPEEQRSIAEAQQCAIDAAAATHDIVVCDTSALMTAVYSRLLFDDRSLEPMAVDSQRRMAITLLTALDLPWVPDGIQRDGPHVRRYVDDLLRGTLLAHGLGWSLVSGSGAQRLQSALDAVAPLLRNRTAPRRGLFTRLDERNAGRSAQAWSCENCDDPACEHRLRT